MDEQQFESPDAIVPESRSGAGRIALVVFGVAAAYFLWMEHRAHVIQYLPWTFLLLCPLMHVFMHHGHGHGGHGADADGQHQDRNP